MSCVKALRKERDRRYKNATEFIHDLENCISWQLRSKKKVAIARFLKKLDKNLEMQSDDSIRAAIYIKGFSRIWSIMQNVVIIMAIYISVLLGIQFKSSEMGYIKLFLPDNDLMYQLDYKDPISAKSIFPTIGPVLKGQHRLTVTQPEYGGTYVSYCLVAPSDTTYLDVALDTKRDSAKISFSSLPSNAETFLDGKSMGNTPIPRFTPHRDNTISKLNIQIMLLNTIP